MVGVAAQVLLVAMGRIGQSTANLLLIFGEKILKIRALTCPGE
jgi:hypothetical protein